MKVKLPKNVDAPINFTHGKEYLVTSRIGSKGVIAMVNDDDGNECGVLIDNGDDDTSGCAFLGCKGKWVIVDDSVDDTEKPFDITQHEWSDEAKDCHVLFSNPSWVGNDLQIEIPDPNGNYADAVLIKEHAIAIAKHFKLTAEDLK